MTKPKPLIVRRRCVYRHRVAEDESRCEYGHELEFKDGKVRACYLDIETTNLDAEFGQILSYAIKPRGKSKVIAKLVKARSLEAEKELIEHFLQDIQGFNVWITYNGTRFDIPFLRSRAMYYGLAFIPYGAAKHIDLIYVARSRLRMRRWGGNRLSNISRYLSIDGKSSVEGETWVKGILGDRASLEEILRHNIGDVVALEKFHRLMEPYMASTRRSI